MTTLQPRGPYSEAELRKLYPEGLKLQLVQILLRHGERSPVSARFQNAGLQAFWPYCKIARHMVSSTIDATESKWGQLEWRRRLETFGSDDGPVVASGPRGEVDSIYETLFPNDGNCRRFAQLSRAFAQRTADRWNNTSDMDYLNLLISKWMPDGGKRVAVDSHPRLSGIMDTINSTLAHGPQTRLPDEFYDPKGRAIIEKIGVEEWFSGYRESQEYRAVGIGGLMGDLVERMVGSAESNANDGLFEIGGKDGSLGQGRGGEKAIKFGLSGCHDTTLAAVLTSLGAFDGEPWPPYTSHIALELFKKSQTSQIEGPVKRDFQDAKSFISKNESRSSKGFFASIFGGNSAPESMKPVGIARKPTEKLSAEEKSRLDGYFVRIRYNDKVMTVPGCTSVGKHLEGDESFCTLEAFKAIVDKYTPQNWKKACWSNLDAPAFPEKDETAGY
ncbi:4-nitrophenylphosphatase/Acid phosphatase [Chlorociboria aeruginascens]|nr:4-nitrophenylphosphatase/Acid phosphatase [Chlorociboria aeruginascens]